MYEMIYYNCYNEEVTREKIERYDSKYDNQIQQKLDEYGAFYCILINDESRIELIKVPKFVPPTITMDK